MRYIIKNKFKLNVIIKRFFIYTIPILILFNFLGYIRNNSQINTLKSEYEARQSEVVSIVSYVLNSVFSDTYNDLLIIKHEDEFTDFIDNPSEQVLQDMEQMLFRVSSRKPNYSQIRYLNKDGYEVVRLNNYNGDVQIVPPDKLQDKSERYYYKSALDAPMDSLYISYLDLNIENNKIIVPHEPVLRFSMPIYKDGEYIGMIIINYDGYKLLAILNNYSDIKDNLITVGVFDSKSYWQLEKEDISDKDILLKYHVHDIIPKEVLDTSISANSSTVSLDNIEYKIQYIHDLNDIKIHFDDNNTMGVVSCYNIDEVISNSDYVMIKYPFVPYLSNLFIMLVSLLIILLNYHSKTDILMLSASKYISEFTHDGIIITDYQKKVIYCNTVFIDTFGYSLNTIEDKYIKEVLKGKTNIELPSEDPEEYSWEGNVWNVSINNTYILRYLKIKLIQEKKNDLAYFIGIYSEPKVDQKVLSKAKWNKQSLGKVENNLITGLHSIFNKVFTDNKKNIVIVIKINDFNDIKFRIEDKEENSFILTITGKIKSILDEESIVLAPSSNMLIIKTPSFSHEDEVRTIMESIDNVFRSMEISDNPSFGINYLSGVAVSQNKENDSIDLLKNAFVALEAIIKIKKSKYLVYNENIYDLVKKDKTIRNELAYAFEKNEFSVVYQVQKTTDDIVIGVEALVRWENEALGVVPPSLFVPIMEESEYIKKLGLHVLKTVVKDFETIKDIISESFKISINLSSNEFTDMQIVTSLIDIISSSELRLESFCFEITETTLVNNLKHTNQIIHYLHGKKILVSIDDFGTGFSSLSYLKTLYADKLKIDRIFIKDYPKKDDGTMIKAIISMATQLRIGVIVEGIETDAQLELIKSLDCNEYQGYYGSKPIKFKKFVELFMKKK